MPDRRVCHTIILALFVMLIGGLHPARAEGRLLVFAAISLQDALTSVADAYPGGKPAFSFAASSALARQIEHGAPAAIFISADEDWMDHLAARGLIVQDSRRALLANRLVLVVPAGERRTADLDSGFDLQSFLGGRRLAMADPDAVPAGRYGKAALEHFGLWETVAARLVRADNVRSALAFVERGEVAAAIVYATDARATDKVAVAAEFSGLSHPPIRYPAAIVAGCDGDRARDFLSFLQSDRAAALFARFGFTRPG